MIDINLIRQDPDAVQTALLKRMDEISFDELLGWDRDRRELIPEIDTLRETRNKVSAQVPAMKNAGKDTTKLQEEMRDVSGKIKELEASLSEIEASIKLFLQDLPNIPADDVPAGDKENNQVIRKHGEKPDQSWFDPKDHVDLATNLGLIDYERGVKLGGNGFVLYRGDGARLEWALLNYFVDEHLKDGYEFVLPPHLLIEECGFAAGQFPKFHDDVFHVKGGETKHFLLPTSETALINFHRGEILPEAELPMKYFAYTPCYRKEAGSYRANERGMIRSHQFNKIEIFQFTRPEDSDDALEELINKAERLVQGLGLHYQVSKLAARDCSASMAKTYDIEVWIPSMAEYKEVSSASNAHSYQARRGNIRYKKEETGKNDFIHSLNASGLATSRLLPAIVEQFQRDDGSVAVPEVLQDRMGKSDLTPAV
ncbi:MAG: serine--tRNA ligase [Candidatus Latescibacterota bacterium]|nr:serine--tRNA ligase [Candidatus Latescibacterota bacterium]